MNSGFAPVAATPEAPADGSARPSRIWRIVITVMAFQIVAIVVVGVLFSAMGFANDGVGSCGGG
jgi:t-SNARE complex subunit (syntaxin)